MTWQKFTLRGVITFSYDSPLISFQAALITQQYLLKVHRSMSEHVLIFFQQSSVVIVSIKVFHLHQKTLKKKKD